MYPTGFQLASHQLTDDLRGTNPRTGQTWQSGVITFTGSPDGAFVIIGNIGRWESAETISQFLISAFQLWPQRPPVKSGSGILTAYRAKRHQTSREAARMGRSESETENRRGLAADVGQGTDARWGNGRETREREARGRTRDVESGTRNSEPGTLAGGQSDRQTAEGHSYG